MFDARRAGAAEHVVRDEGQRVEESDVTRRAWKEIGKVFFRQCASIYRSVCFDAIKPYEERPTPVALLNRWRRGKLPAAAEPVAVRLEQEASLRKELVDPRWLKPDAITSADITYRNSLVTRGRVDHHPIEIPKIFRNGYGAPHVPPQCLIHRRDTSLYHTQTCASTSEEKW